jgi:hypothetical protein
LRESDVDLVSQAEAHERIALAILSDSKTEARNITREAMQGFWDDGARVGGQTKAMRSPK